MPPRITAGDSISLVSYSAEAQALGAPSRPGRPVQLVELGAVSSRLTIWRTGFRYDRQQVIGYGTGALEAGPVYFGACVSLVTVNGHFLSSADDQHPLEVIFRHDTPRDREAFILLDEHGASSQRPVQYGDVVILQRVNGRFLHCTSADAPAFRSTACGDAERFRIWF